MTLYMLFTPGISTFVTLKNISRLLLWIKKNKSNMNLRLVPLNRPGCELYNGVLVYYEILNIQVNVSVFPREVVCTF